MSLARITAAYQKVTAIPITDAQSVDLGAALTDAAAKGHEFLVTRSTERALTSATGKTYFAYERGGKLSRPINAGLFIKDTAAFDTSRAAIFSASGPGSLGAEDATKAIYTLTMSFCASIDLLKSGDKKTPGTFFEYLVAHLIAMRITVNPQQALDLLDMDGTTTQLPTDLVFDPGIGKTKLHVPVKLSTRERVIQAWAHQRMIDSVYGARRFSGLLVVMSETNMIKNARVDEVCLPDQWRLYQMFVAWMTRVYYLDVPAVYSALGNEYPKIDVKSFGHFFLEADTF